MQEAYESEDSRTVMFLMSQFLMIPVAAFLYSVDLLLRTMQGVQEVTIHGVEVMVGPNAFSGRTHEAGGVAARALSDSRVSNTTPEGSQIPNKEDRKLIETNQNFCKPDQKESTCVILWRYKVLFIKRDLEHAFDECEDLIPDDVTDITAWKIAEFIQRVAQGEVKVPDKWVKEQYPDPQKYWKMGGLDKDKLPYLTGLPEEDKQFLRLYTEQVARYQRQEPKYEERQIKVLKEIRDKLGPK